MNPPIQAEVRHHAMDTAALRPANADDLLAKAAKRTLARDPSAHKLALLALAALGTDNPLHSRPARSAAQ